MRPKIMITNTDKNQKIMDGWFVRVGKKTRVFTEKDAQSGEHLKWLNAQLGGAA